MPVRTYDRWVTRRALVVAYHFPPVGGAGVQRTVKFVRHLPEFGYEPTVLTGPGLSSRMPPDGTFAEQLPANLVIHRLAPTEPSPAEGWRGRTERWLRVETAWGRWWRRGIAAHRMDDVDVVVATMSPFQSAQAVAKLARKYGVPWVADLRDPWALDEMQVYETALHRWLDVRRMGRELASAAAVVMNTPEAAAALTRQYDDFDPTRVYTIPNGYDAADFEQEVSRPNDGVFRIVHAGVFHTSLGRDHRRSSGMRRVLGGSVGHVDILPRSHVYLIQALDRVLDEVPRLRGRIRLELVGALSRDDCAAMPAGSVVRALGYRPHHEAVGFLRRADLLFLPMHDVVPPYRTRIIPGKTYEYLAAGRPILAAVPSGDARDLLEASGNALLCTPADVDAMTRLLRDEIVHVLAEGRRPDKAVAGIERYERRALTEQLASVLDDVVGVVATERKKRIQPTLATMT